ncbi:interleukin-3 receptor subunit alpha [Dromiciops gliroides]|uniref:interleukin-3 receptor subunit alpha n=1 Tax=Dromiciops gliroides TaxID=33562 RepID=UPI001CC56C1C|nr:interleukin-3 receptor subunit alpha [Dromiciops gliroides]
MADLMAFIWFSMLLTTAYSQTQKQEVPDSPVKNLTIDMKTMKLRWTNVENVNKINCSATVLSKFIYTVSAKGNSCKLPAFHTWCQGVDFVIEGFAGKRISETLHVLRRGKEGTTKENLSCQVHDANFMDCKWTVRETPGDLQYQFFYSKSANAFVDSECPKYKTDSEGRHVGCHFSNLSVFNDSIPYHFLVNGTSNGREVQCNDEYISLNSIEIFKPPNITINNTAPNCIIQWQKPKSLFNSEFEYELQIQKVSDKTILEMNSIKGKTKIDCRNIDGRHTVKIRTKKLYDEYWSEWSEPQKLGDEVRNDNLLSVLMLPLLGIAFIMLLVLGYLCKRYYVIQKIFPPVPHIKDQVSDSFHKYIEVVWEGNKILPEQCKIEEIQVIEKKSNCP